MFFFSLIHKKVIQFHVFNDDDVGGGGLMPTNIHKYLEHDNHKEMLLCMVFKVISDKIVFFVYVNHI